MKSGLKKIFLAFLKRDKDGDLDLLDFLSRTGLLKRFLEFYQLQKVQLDGLP